ncbi:hypothetical protein [Streptomyces sp. 5-10]|uniref:hypothetical protein n=1 Tax=Streptomyces sp. 5-10 TaxID=878925 RepID=UPI00168B618E|nr:hypothetical protein [Streptomyces sp. 5-10]MBD3008420.1 hypothetical protein [Streptomyces sp. 5-10]
MPHKPAWFREDKVFVSYAPTVGINKDGEELFVVDPETGLRTSEIDDQIKADVIALVDNLETTDTSRWIDVGSPESQLLAVPNYFDERSIRDFQVLMESPEFEGYTSKTIGELIHSGTLESSHGHGSPSADFRTGHVPYIKVSDIRAGQVNINPTNRVPDVVAERFWKGKESGLKAFDLITPIRTSKNIGEFALIMPGQERVVLTKEVLVLRASGNAPFDNFYLLWAMTLKAVRRQWDRIVFMQTNREDVGKRYEEIRIPVPPSREEADNCSKAFRNYYLGTQKLRDDFLSYLAGEDKHYIFMASAVASVEEIVDDSEPATD